MSDVGEMPDLGAEGPHPGGSPLSDEPGDGGARHVPGDRPTDSGPAPGRPPASDRRDGWVLLSGTWVERAQDVISVAVAVALIGLAAAILLAAVVDFFTRAHRLGLTRDGTTFLDDVLLVLILVEVVHTVVLSLRAHALVAQPFLVVGLVAVVRKILFTLGGAQKISDATLALYIGMVAVFVVSLVVVRLTARRSRPDDVTDVMASTG